MMTNSNEAHKKYHEKYDDAVYLSAVEGKSTGYANQLIDTAMAYCNHPYYPITEARLYWPDKAKSFLSLFQDDIPSLFQDEVLEKSNGHIEFLGQYEYFERNEQLYRAGSHLPVKTDGYRSGRWETKMAFAEDHLEWVKKYI